MRHLKKFHPAGKIACGVGVIVVALALLDKCLPASTEPLLVFCVEAMELGTDVGDSEPPLDSGVLIVAAKLPRLNGGAHRLKVCATAAEAIAREDGDFDLGHVQPTALGRLAKYRRRRDANQDRPLL